MKRGTFITTSGIALAGTLLSCKSTLGSVHKSPRNVKFDLHAHPGAFYLNSETSSDDFIKRLTDMKSNGLNGAFVCIVSDYPILKRTETGIIPNGKFSNNEGWEEFENQLKILKNLFRKASIRVSVDPADVDSDDFVVYIACEGGDFLDGKIENVEKAYDRDVRSIQLVHYAPNLLGDLQTWKSEHGGLSSFGKEVVVKMNELGMLIDVAHASSRTVKMVTDMSKHPVMLSHSILKSETSSPVGARAISVDHAKMVSSNGGIIGMWPSGFSASFNEFVEHTYRMIDAVGIDHVGIGTDMDSNYKPVLKNYKEFNGWAEALSSKGLSKKEVGQLTGGNAQRVLREVF